MEREAKIISDYLSRELRLCIVTVDNKPKGTLYEAMYWHGAKLSALMLLELVTKDRLERVLKEKV